MNRQHPKGFTLIELMIVVVILGVLASIVQTKITEAIRRSQEARTKGNLAQLRASISLYRVNNGGTLPAVLEDITRDPNAILLELPLKFTPPYHPEGNTVTNGGAADRADSIGHWFYYNVPDELLFGTVVVNCVHPDLSGKVWDTY